MAIAPQTTRHHQRFQVIAENSSLQMRRLEEDLGSSFGTEHFFTALGQVCCALFSLFQHF